MNKGVDYSIDSLVEIWMSEVKKQYKNFSDYGRKTGLSILTLKKWRSETQKTRPNTFNQQVILDSIKYHFELNGERVTVFQIPELVQKEYQYQSSLHRMLPISFWLSRAKTSNSYELPEMYEVIKYLGMDLTIVKDEVVTE